MFHSFHVDPEHRATFSLVRRQYTRQTDNGVPNECSPPWKWTKPSCYYVWFKKADGKEEFGENAAEFVHRNFYLVTATQEMLATTNLKLHKVVSNSVEVMEAFPVKDRGKEIRDQHLGHDSLPAQSLLEP